MIGAVVHCGADGPKADVPMYRLHIANKNYSSWSLRPWVLMRALDIPFEERLVPFHDAAAWQAFRALSPHGKVPCLVDGGTVVWESPAIVEYLAERHPQVWPRDPVARAWARSVASEMHAGFMELRSRCSMSCGVRMRLREITPALRQDIARISALWNEGLERFGGPFLAGETLTAADAFFAPVVFRIQTWGLKLQDPAAEAYVQRMLALDAMESWYAQALNEDFRHPPHDEDLNRSGVLLQDLRVAARAE